MSDAGHFELVDGELVERNVSYESSFIGALVNARLMLFVIANKLGWVVQADCGLQIYADDPAKVRFADGAFVSRNRPDASPPGRGHLRAAPDLVLEVVSPNDNAEEVETKLAEYLAAGVRRVWVVYPEARAVHVFRPGGNDSRFTTTDTLSGEDVVPGFELPVAEIFDF